MTPHVCYWHIADHSSHLAECLLSGVKRTLFTLWQDCERDSKAGKNDPWHEARFDVRHALRVVVSGRENSPICASEMAGSMKRECLAHHASDPPMATQNDVIGQPGDRDWLAAACFGRRPLLKFWR
jgi:hypothetical protein